jgi:hypothetical protein
MNYTSHDYYILYLDSNDVVKWATLFGGGGDDYVFGLSISPNYNIYLAGATYYWTDFPYACPTQVTGVPYCNGSFIGGNMFQYDATITRLKMDSVIGISENPPLTYGSLIAYPNPSDGSFSVSLVLEKQVKKLTLNIYNSLGQVIKTEEYKNAVGNFKRAVNISNYMPGLYYVQAIADDRQYSTKIIKSDR